MTGKLELIIGPMFSGKSTELIRQIRLLRKIDKKVLVIKPSIDDRYNDDKITSHNYEAIDCQVLNKLNEISDTEIKKYDTIIVDEGQFFSDLIQTIINWVDNYNLNIIVAGLDGDFQRQPLGDILALIPYADKCSKLTSLCNICKDGTEAPFSYRLIKSLDKILVGGAETYIPVCRKHYKQLTIDYNSEK
jgi:thymidine kinase